MTKIRILKAEFQHLQEYSPIEHVGSRLKSPESILGKLRRRGLPVDSSSLDQLYDIAGIRVDGMDPRRSSSAPRVAMVGLLRGAGIVDSHTLHQQ